MNPIEPQAPAPPSASAISNIFLDRDGLRAVWGIALFLFFWEILRQFIFPLFQSLFPTTSTQGSLLVPRAAFVFEGAALLCAAIPTWLLTKFESRPVSAYGFSPQRCIQYFLTGLACGAALLSLLVLTLRVSGLLVFDGRLLFGRSILRYGLVWTGGFLLVALAEEVFLRGYLQFTLGRGLSEIYRRFLGPVRANAAGFWTAAFILSCYFGIGHRSNPGESPLGLLAAALVGVVFCLSIWRTGSLWWAIGFHAAWDWAQSFLYGVADSGLIAQGRLFATHPAGRPILSGGLTGPEGSIFLLPILLIAIAAIFLTLPRTHFGYTPAYTPESAPRPTVH